MWDLTQPIREGMPTYPGDPSVTVEPVATVAADGYAVRAVSLGSHTGTHVDAPAHVFADGRTLDDYPPERFVFDAVRVDCRDLDARARIPPERVPPAGSDCVVFHTGWDDHWTTPQARDHPYLAPETARACVERGLAVATDTLSPDPTPSANGERGVDPTAPDSAAGSDSVDDADSTGEPGSTADSGSTDDADSTADSGSTDDADSTADSGSTDGHEPTDDGPEPDGVPAHETLLGADRLIVENLRGLDRVPDRFELRAVPLALGGDGAPVRAVAVAHDD